MKKLFWIMGTWIALSFLFIGGCAPKVVPVESITSAEMAIRMAKESNATIHATLELKLAEDKLNDAKFAVDEEDFDRARRLADEALVEAKLAEAKSRSVKAKKNALEMQKNIDSLRQEIERVQQIESKE